MGYSSTYATVYIQIVRSMFRSHLMVNLQAKMTSIDKGEKMSGSDQRHEKNIQLRIMAEELARKNASAITPDSVDILSEETRKALHELSVHQIELEMQNEELHLISLELEAARTRYFDLFNQAPVGYFSLNEVGLILESNLTAATMFGVSASGFQDKLFSSWILPEDQDIFYHHRKGIFSTGVPHVCELRMKKNAAPDPDKVIWVRLESSIACNNASITEPQGNPGLVCQVIVSDISEKMRAASQTQQSQRMETIGMIAGGVAHDFNNKLAVIIGYAELALNNEIPAQTVRSFLEEILKAAQLSAALTRQLLTIARKQPVVPVVLDLNLTIAKSLKMLQQIVGAEIELIWQPGASLLSVKIDPVQIDQILVNLCVNAKAAISVRGKVTITTGNVTSGVILCDENPDNMQGEYVMLEISDNGCGMPREILNQIFEPFFTTRDVNQGTGLGLATVEGIVKQNDGFINVSSEPGSGTTFSIYLPVFTDLPVDSQQEHKEEMLPGTGETVLVVEDETALLPMIKVMLEKLGFRVLTASSPMVAIDLVQKHKDEIRLLLTDVIMPEMNGSTMVEVVQQINPKIETLFMSGYSANVLAQRGVLKSKVNLIQKPFLMTDLAEKIGELLFSPVCPNPSIYRQ